MIFYVLRDYKSYQIEYQNLYNLGASYFLMVDKIRVIGNLLFILVIGFLFLFLFYNNSKNAQVTANVILDEQNNGITFEIKQSVDSLKFNHNNLSYKLEENCTHKRTEGLLMAFGILSKSTNLSFYKTNSSADIRIFCSKLNNSDVEQDTSKLAEGGPTLIVGKEILEGKVILYLDNSNLNCSQPIAELHEIFHVLGFLHTLQEGSILYPIANCNQEIDEEVIAIINKLYSRP